MFALPPLIQIRHDFGLCQQEFTYLGITARLPGSSSSHRITTRATTQGEEEGEIGRDALFPDEQVMSALMRNLVARKYFLDAARTVDASRADWDLARSLAFFCHANVEQMRRLFLKSVLVRPKT